MRKAPPLSLPPSPLPLLRFPRGAKCWPLPEAVGGLGTLGSGWLGSPFIRPTPAPRSFKVAENSLEEQRLELEAGARWLSWGRGPRGGSDERHRGKGEEEIVEGRREKGGEAGSSCCGRRGARWLPVARAPRFPGMRQAANGSAEVYSRWRPTAPFLPPPPPPPVLRSQSRRRVARRWNGWSPDTHHHLFCTRKARDSAAPSGCGGGTGKAGEYTALRCAPSQGCRAPGWGGDGAEGGAPRVQTLFFLTLGSLLLSFSGQYTGTCKRSFPDTSGLRPLEKGRAARGAACGDPWAGKAEVPYPRWAQTSGHRTELWEWDGKNSDPYTSSLLWGC